MKSHDKHVQTPKGQRDVFEEELLQREALQKRLYRIARRNGYVRVETSPIESTKLFQRTSEFDPDKCYTFLDKASRELVLRPDLNAPLARVVANWDPPLHMPARLFFEGRVFRYRHNMKRSFRIFCLETFGVKEPEADADVLRILSDITKELGFAKMSVDYSDLRLYKTLLVHSANIPEPTASEFLHKFRFSHSEQEEQILFESYDIPSKVARTLHSWLHADETNETNQDLLKEAERDYPEMQEAIRRVRDFEESMRDFHIDSFRLTLSNLHGMGFYSGLTFRVTPEGCPKPLADGGRFDHMISALGGKETPATGIAFGIERLLRFLKAAGRPITTKKSDDSLLISYSDPGLANQVRPLLKQLRNDLSVVEALGIPNTHKKLFDHACANKMTHLVIIHPTSALETWNVEMIATGSPEEISFNTTHSTFVSDILTRTRTMIMGRL